ncbi:unnamed protein product [Clonostachys rosea]|uniref:Cytochrome P450 n=1 Tax=Bionectria ochroleuca TaxID=29856 RepID=A0ABY6U0Z8_BIOOC|nr:unnamed protein product [Clonostachys rosea]
METFTSLMSSLGISSVTHLSFALGIVAHVFFFRKGEWDLYTTHLILCFLSAQIACGAYIFVRNGVTATHAWMLTNTISFHFLFGVFASMMTYRTAFHRLNRFPGPMAARFSNIYLTWLSTKGFRRHEEIMRLHKEYGDIVRTGPSELSIVDPLLFRSIHSQSSGFTKGPWYNLMRPAVSLHMIRDHNEHGHRRKIWDKGFSSKALREYEPRVAYYTQQLLKQIASREGQPVNISTLFNFFSFDVMGDLAFGQSFDMLTDGTAHEYMKSARDDMLTATAFSHLVWILPLLKSIPGLNHRHVQLQKWLATQVDQRRKNPPPSPDIFSWILDGYECISRPTQQDGINLQGDAHLIVVAGSDLTAASLTCLFYQLALHPEIMAELQNEIDQMYAKHAHPDHQDFSKLRYLNACIDESLRLYPPVPSGLQRMSPPQGYQAGDVHIPGSTVVQVPSYTMHRGIAKSFPRQFALFSCVSSDPRFFVQPDEFIPERWTTRPELVRDSSVFAPFSFGPYSCVGKQLGLMELRAVTCQILKQFNVGASENNEPNQFHADVRDGLTLITPDLNLVFVQRDHIDRC